MGTKLTHTSRRYQAVICQSGAISKVELTAMELLLEQQEAGVEHEFIYALRQRMDDVLDIKLHESIYFQPSRDDINTMGILLRVQ